MQEKFKILTAALILALALAATSCSERTEKQIQPTDMGLSQPETYADETEEQKGIAQEKTEMKMKIKVGEDEFTATLADNSTVDEFVKLIGSEPLTLDMSDYAGMEKGADLGTTLTQDNEPMNTVPGDIILNKGRTLVIYYDTNSWILTPIGKIDDVDSYELREALGEGDVSVTFTIE